MFHIILYQPEIPPNTGNILRLCANTGFSLHLIKPLGFFISDKSLKRAALDYIDLASIKTYDNLNQCLKTIKYNKVYAISTKGKTCYSNPKYKNGDAFLFGPETRGLPIEILKEFPDQNILRIPMTSKSRSLNLSNSVAIQVFEAWRQNNYLE